LRQAYDYWQDQPGSRLPGEAGASAWQHIPRSAPIDRPPSVRPKAYAEQAHNEGATLHRMGLDRSGRRLPVKLSEHLLRRPLESDGMPFTGLRLEKRLLSLRPPDKLLLPFVKGRMSPGAVWPDGCTSKSTEPVSIQAPQPRSLSLHGRGPSVQLNGRQGSGLARLSPSESDPRRLTVTQQRRSVGVGWIDPSLSAFLIPPDIYPIPTFAHKYSLRRIFCNAGVVQPGFGSFRGSGTWAFS
jgi:hypothetical protein